MGLDDLKEHSDKYTIISFGIIKPHNDSTKNRKLSIAMTYLVDKALIDEDEHVIQIFNNLASLLD